MSKTQVSQQVTHISVFISFLIIIRLMDVLITITYVHKKISAFKYEIIEFRILKKRNLI